MAGSWSWLGDEAFDDAAHMYIKAKPPTSWTLDAFGRGFDEILAVIYSEDPEVRELAWLDWALRQAYSSADMPPLDQAALATADWSAARCAWHPVSVIRHCRQMRQPSGMPCPATRRHRLFKP